MSVNVIDKSKAKLLSHILKPKTLNQKPRDESSESEEEKVVEPKKEKRKVKSVEFLSTTDDDEDEENRSKVDGQLQTVNMEELGDLFSSKSKTTFYAVKSDPKMTTGIGNDLPHVPQAVQEVVEPAASPGTSSRYRFRSGIRFRRGSGDASLRQVFEGVHHGGVLEGASGRARGERPSFRRGSQTEAQAQTRDPEGQGTSSSDVRRLQPDVPNGCTT